VAAECRRGSRVLIRPASFRVPADAARIQVPIDRFLWRDGDVTRSCDGACNPE